MLQVLGRDGCPLCRRPIRVVIHAWRVPQGKIFMYGIDVTQLVSDSGDRSDCNNSDSGYRGNSANGNSGSGVTGDR
jgi:hypothetical protein